MMALRRVIAGICIGLGLAACSSPLGDITRLSDLAVSVDQDAASIAEAPQEAAGPGFFGRLFGQVGSAEAAPIEAGGAGPVASRGGGTDAIPGDDAMDDAQSEDARPAAAPNGAGGGLLGFLRDNMGRPSSGAAPSSDGPDSEVIPPGLRLGFGQIATVCGVSARQLGTRIARQAGFTLYDTAPNSRRLRTFHVTGFADDCARQFSGVVAMFGDAGMHEAVRYNGGTDDIAFSETDAAYEEIKGWYCGVPSGQPCGGRIDSLSRELVFLSVYSAFGTTSEWAEILLHDGEVVAMDLKSS